MIREIFICKSFDEQLDNVMKFVVKEKIVKADIIFETLENKKYAEKYFNDRYFIFKSDRYKENKVELKIDLKNYKSVSITTQIRVYSSMSVERVKDLDGLNIDVVLVLSEENITEEGILNNIEIESKLKYRVNLDKCSIRLNSGKKIKTHLVNYEIRKKFIEALKIAEFEIDIISPWMNERVVDSEMVELFEINLKKGVAIKIIYGIGNIADIRNNKSEELAKKLQLRFEKYEGLFQLKKRNTHYKLLLCDNKFGLSGSYNFLSFDGDYSCDDVRSEGAELILDKLEIDKRRKLYFGEDNDEDDRIKS